MKNIRLILVLTLLAPEASSCIDFRHDIDGGRWVEIERTAPQANAETGARAKFGVMIRDSKNDPKSLQVYARVDAGKSLRCAQDSTPTNSIERTVDEMIFRCPIDPSQLANGKHGVDYWVINRDGDTAADRSVSFKHDAVPPDLRVHATPESNNTSLSWSAGDPREFNELTVTMNGVRIFTSFVAEGNALLDANLVKSGSQLDVRAFDKQRNSSVQTVMVP